MIIGARMKKITLLSLIFFCVFAGGTIGTSQDAAFFVNDDCAVVTYTVYIINDTDNEALLNFHCKTVNDQFETIDEFIQTDFIGPRERKWFVKIFAIEIDKWNVPERIGFICDVNGVYLMKGKAGGPI